MRIVRSDASETNSLHLLPSIVASTEGCAATPAAHCQRVAAPEHGAPDNTRVYLPHPDPVSRAAPRGRENGSGGREGKRCRPRTTGADRRSGATHSAQVGYGCF
jgi:hypothetical protein